MTTPNNCSSHTDGKEFFDHLLSKSSLQTYPRLYDYITDVTNHVRPEQSFYVLDLADILWKVQLWREKLPGITPFFAVKANPDPLLIRLFVLLGFSFDCSTMGEIDLILENGGRPANIIYAHTVKPCTSLTYAKKVGVDLLTFDSKEELQKLKKYFPEAKLIIRLKPESPKCMYDLSQKFGCTASEAKELLLIAKDLNLNIIGVSFHVGALCTDPSCFTKTIRLCEQIFTAAQQLGFQLTVLDLGAGFFGSSQREKHFDMVASEIKMALKQFFPDNKVQVIAEPGCYYVCSAQRQVTCVLGKRAVQKQNLVSNGYHDERPRAVQMHYYLNDGYYGSFYKDIEIYDVVPKPLLESQELSKRLVFESKLWGQTCCSYDVILERCLLPELEDGDYVVWENMGAYTLGVCSTFTMVPIPIAKHVFIKNPRLHLNWIENLDQIAEFISENAYLIEGQDSP